MVSIRKILVGLWRSLRVSLRRRRYARLMLVLLVIYVSGLIYMATAISDIGTRSRATPTPTPNERRKIISMSLTGSNIRFTTGVVRNAELALTLLPGWTVWVYMEDPTLKPTYYPEVPMWVVKRLRRAGAELKYVDTKNPWHVSPVFWRFMVYDDPSVKFFVIRDAEFRLSSRDVAAINAWLTDVDEKAMHCIRDHPSQESRPCWPGLWGARRSKLRSVLSGASLSNLLNRNEEYTIRDDGDVRMLEEQVWSKALKMKQAVCHDSFHCDREGAKPFPVMRIGNEYVGQRFNENDTAVDNAYLVQLSSAAVVENCTLNFHVRDLTSV